MTDTLAYIPLSEYLPEELWPAAVLAPSGAGFLDDIAYLDGEVSADDDAVFATVRLRVLREVAFDLVAGLAIVVGRGDVSATLTVDEEGWRVRLVTDALKLRLPAGLFRPAVVQSGRYVVDPDPAATVDLAIPFAVTVDSDGSIDVEWPGEGETLLDLPPCMIGDSGVVVRASDVGLRLSAESPVPDAAFAAGLPDDWRGLFFAEAEVQLPAGLAEAIPDDVRLADCFIGTGGFTGSVAANWTPAFAGTLFGITFGLSHLGLSFVQNAITASDIRGELTLPFFDAPVAVTIGLELGGGVTVAVTGAGPGGLHTLVRPGVCEFTLESIGFELDDGEFLARLSGTLQPTLGRPALDWPAITVRELAIDSHGNVRVNGGWLDLERGYPLDLYGFRFELTRLGFGRTDDGGRWIGFNGALKLVDGLSAGASVEGLRISWYDDRREPALTLDGVGVEFEIPSVIRFKGAVSYREYQRDGATVHRFDGSIAVELIALGFEVDGALVIGVADRGNGPEPFMAVHLAAELPAGIPLWSTGLGIFGLAGLVAGEMEPDKAPAEKWYALDEPDWFHRGTPGVTDLNKWDFAPGAFALGAGVTLGTVVDNGFTFNGRFLLLFVFPGPIVMLEGRANLLKERASLASEPLFHALAVLDARRGEFTFGLDARYRFGAGGELIDIGGGAEAYFSLANPRGWHLHLGRDEPRDRRIRAQILSLFEANTYFMLDADSVRMGAWIGYDQSWKFGPLRVAVEAWAEGDARISWNPAHFSGSLWLHGLAELSVFGFGVRLRVDAKLTAEVFDPFHVVGEFGVGIGLPWPLPDFDVDIVLEWGPAKVWPSLPLPLKEVAIEHGKTTTSWPLRRTAARGSTALLRPNYDAGGGVLVGSPPASPALQAPPANAPVVPLDARPRLTFARPMHDEALIGVNPQPPMPVEEVIGDPQTKQGAVAVRYELREVALQRWNGLVWQAVAGAAQGDPAKTLYGSWAPLPAPGGVGVAQTKLSLWSRNPFDWTRRTSRAWDDWFTPTYPGYPCQKLPGTDRCWKFGDQEARGPITDGWQHPGNGPSYTWPAQGSATIRDEAEPVAGLRVALRVDQPEAFDHHRGEPLPATLVIMLPPGANAGVRLVVRSEQGVQVLVGDVHATVHGPFSGGTPADPELRLPVTDVAALQITGATGFCLFEVCVLSAVTPQEQTQRTAMAKHLVTSLERWKADGNVLQPHQQYRLRIQTRLVARPLAGGGLTADPTRTLDQTEFAYFRTEGPPALTDLSLPAGTTPTDENTLRDPNGNEIGVDGERVEQPVLKSALNNLTPYVAQTLPPTVPGPGERPVLPRPVYRGYDVGVAFNEDYVDLLYRLAGRDLSLVLFDANNRPVRDTYGRLIAQANGWHRSTADPLADETTARWVTTIIDGSCGKLSPKTISRPVEIGADGHVLRPDTVHEARLVPLLLHETFTGYATGAFAVGPAGRLGNWQVVDQTATGVRSRWEIVSVPIPPGRIRDVIDIGDVVDIGHGEINPGQPPLVTYAVVQRSAIGGESPDQSAKPGTLLIRADDPALSVKHPDQPRVWTDYRFTVTVRPGGDDALGVVFRYRDANNHYRFSMDRQRQYRRLVRVAAGTTTVLAEGDVAYHSGQDITIAVEAIGGSLRVLVDGAVVFDVVDNAFPSGSVGLYTWRSVDARFADVRIDDFRDRAPVAYRFRFTTSAHTDFVHQMHSYDDITWRLRIAAEISTRLAAAVPLTATPGDAEHRDFDALVTAASELGALLRTPAVDVEVTRLETADGRPLAFVVRSPEPIDWQRTSLQVRRAADLTRPGAPGVGKLIAVARGATPAQESVTLLLREPVSPEGWRIERRALPGPLQVDPGSEPLFNDRFAVAGTTGWTISDEGTVDAPSAWSVVGSELRQTRPIASSTPAAQSPRKQGTSAVAGDAGWTDYALVTRLRSTRDGAIGVYFRYRDADNWYRFVMDRASGYRQVVRSIGGRLAVLWQDEVAYESGRTYEVTIVAHGADLRGYLDGIATFAVLDDSHRSGRVGFWCWANPTAFFANLRVYPAEVAAPVGLFGPSRSLGILGAWTVHDSGELAGPSRWEEFGTGLRQTTNIHSDEMRTAPDKRGTTAVTGRPDLADLRFTVRLRTDWDNDAIGIVTRYQDAENHYRFSIDTDRYYRRLVKVVGGVVTTLWEDLTIGYRRKRDYLLTMECVANRIRVFLDGVLLAEVRDGDLAAGQVGLYCWANKDARFLAAELVEPDWVTYAVLRSVGPLAAGTRVRVVGGGPTSAGPGEVVESAAGPGQQGSRSFDADETIDLRLRDAAGQSLHQRRFLPEQALAAAGGRVLRNADGRVLVLVPDPPVSAGTYELRWRYRRDVGGSAPKLSRAGDSSDEQANLAVPWPTMDERDH